MKVALLAQPENMLCIGERVDPGSGLRYIQYLKGAISIRVFDRTVCIRNQRCGALVKIARTEFPGIDRLLIATTVKHLETLNPELYSTAGQEWEPLSEIDLGTGQFVAWGNDAAVDLIHERG